jgi:Rod binding domain-containing protein
MNAISSLPATDRFAAYMPATNAAEKATAKVDGMDTKEAFQQFVGETFYGMMLKQMRQSVEQGPYFHGGQGEAIFQQQLDQVLVERMSAASADTFAEPMYALFMNRQG